MNSFNVSLEKIIPENKSYKFVSKASKVPYKPDYTIVSKDEYGRLSYLFDKPKNMNIGGYKVKNVNDYSSIKYSDATTQNGKIYNINTSNKEISAYTHDGKFALAMENYQDPKSIKLGDKTFYGHVSKAVYPDGAKKYNITTPNYSFKTIKVSADGTVLSKEKNGAKNIVSSLTKPLTNVLKKAANITKMLKFL